MQYFPHPPSPYLKSLLCRENRKRLRFASNDLHILSLPTHPVNKLIRSPKHGPALRIITARRAFGLTMLDGGPRGLIERNGKRLGTS